MNLELLQNSIGFIIGIIYTIIITFIVYLYDYNSTIINKFLENLNIYGSIENLDKYYNFKKKHSNGIALFTHTSYLDGIILVFIFVTFLFSSFHFFIPPSKTETNFGLCPK